MKRSIRSISLLLALVTMLIHAGTAYADEGTSSASCGFSAGDGSDGDLKTVNHIAWPEQKLKVNEDEDSWYLPCGPRNFANSDGSIKKPDGNPLGDKLTAIEVTAPSGVKYYVYLTAYFMVNQDVNALRDLFTYCFKFTCPSMEDAGGDQNSSTPGWNNMLAETFGPALARAAREAAYDTSDPNRIITDAIWTIEDPAQFDLLAIKMSEGRVAQQLQFILGFKQPLFCDSFSSGWADPSNPGSEGNTFNCDPNIRVVIDNVVVAEDTNQSPTGLMILNQYRHDAAVILYGEENADQVLADIDVVEACQEAASCIVEVGGANSQSGATVSAVPEPTVIPAPTEEAVQPTQTP